MTMFISIYKALRKMSNVNAISRVHFINVQLVVWGIL